MAKAQINFAELGGGGKSGTKTTSTASTTYTINTGLSSVSKFAMWSSKTISGGDIGSYCAWDASSPTVFQSAVGASNAVGASVKDIALGGSSLSGTNAQRLMVVNSVSGGTVEVKTPSLDTWADLTWTWVAI